MLSNYFKCRENIGGEYYLLKTTAAAALDKNTKTLERAAKAGKLKAIDFQKRTYYKWSDLEEFERADKAPTIKPIIQTPRQTQTTEALAAPPADLENLLNVFGGLFQQINTKLDARPESALQRVSGKLTLDLDELAKFSGFGKTQLSKAIHAAESAGELSRFAGAHGRAVWKCADLDKVIETIQPAAKIARRPPTKRLKK